MVHKVTPVYAATRREAEKLLEAIESLKTWAEGQPDADKMQSVLDVVQGVEDMAAPLVGAKSATLHQTRFFVHKSEGEIPGRQIESDILVEFRRAIESIEDTQVAGDFRQHMHNVVTAIAGVAHTMEEHMPRVWTVIVDREREQQQRQGDKDNEPDSGKTR